MPIGGSTIFAMKISEKPPKCCIVACSRFLASNFTRFCQEKNQNPFCASSKANLSVCEFIVSDAGDFQCNENTSELRFWEVDIVSVV